MIQTLCELKDHWRVMKVRHGDCHPGSINKIEVIRRHGLTAGDIDYPGSAAGLRNAEVFARVRGGRMVTSMTQLEDVTRRRKKFSLSFYKHDRHTGKITFLERQTVNLKT